MRKVNLFTATVAFGVFLSSSVIGQTTVTGDKLNVGTLNSTTGTRSVTIGTRTTASGADSFVVGTGTSSKTLINGMSESFLFGYKGVPVLFGKVEGVIGAVTYGMDPLVPSDPLTYAPRVGIGTTNPKSELHVVGGMKIRGSETDNVSPYVLLDVKAAAEISKLTITNTGTSSAGLSVAGRADIGTLNVTTAFNVNSSNASSIPNLNINSVLNILGTTRMLSFTGQGQRMLTVDNNGQVVPMAMPVNDLGTHIATKNIRTNGYWLSNNGNNDGIFISSSNNVGMGTNNPGTYKLAVNGSIRAKEILVELNNWPDYVFEDGYTLRDLNEVESFINENGHLPEVPSAHQVIEEGINMGEMSHILLKKVEELTLYIIEQDKKCKELESKLEMLIQANVK